MIDKRSRYDGIEIKKWIAPDGREILYLGRRLLPALESFTDLTEHTVSQGERLDHIAWRYLGDPELFWQICDANTELNPPALTAEVGRKIGIPQLPGF
jgi:hypothetical protein